MGHSTMAAALHYQHATDQRAREIAARLSEVVERRRQMSGSTLTARSGQRRKEPGEPTAQNPL